MARPAPWPAQHGRARAASLVCGGCPSGLPAATWSCFPDPPPSEPEGRACSHLGTVLRLRQDPGDESWGTSQSCGQLPRTASQPSRQSPPRRPRKGGSRAKLWAPLLFADDSELLEADCGGALERAHAALREEVALGLGVCGDEPGRRPRSRKGRKVPKGADVTIRPISAKKSKAMLDAMTAPALVELRVNVRNIRVGAPATEGAEPVLLTRPHSALKLLSSRPASATLLGGGRQGAGRGPRPQSAELTKSVLRSRKGSTPQSATVTFEHTGPIGFVKKGTKELKDLEEVVVEPKAAQEGPQVTRRPNLRMARTITLTDAGGREGATDSSGAGASDMRPYHSTNSGGPAGARSRVVPRTTDQAPEPEKPRMQGRRKSLSDIHAMEDKPSTGLSSTATLRKAVLGQSHGAAAFLAAAAAGRSRAPAAGPGAQPDSPAQGEAAAPKEGSSAAMMAAFRRLKGGDEKRWTQVFERLKDPGENEFLPKERLTKAIELTGLSHPPKEDMIEKALKDMQYPALDARGFVKFLYRYQVNYHQWLEETFTAYDANTDNLIDDSEFGALLESCGITPMEKTVRELRIEVGRQNVKGFSFEEFRRAVDLIGERQGFSRREAEKFKAAFAVFDTNKSGSLDPVELARMLGWLGYATSAKEAAELSTEVGLGPGFALNEYDFLVVMRKVREKELVVLQELMEEVDANKNGLIDRTELKALLRALGYHAGVQAISDAVDDMAGGSPRTANAATRSQQLRRFRASFVPGANEPAREYTLAELVSFVEVYRSRDGFSREEVADIEAAFKKYDRDKEGAISTLEVGKVLRWLGFQTSWELQQILVAEVDIDRSGRLDVGELQKLIRKFRERDIRIMTQAYQKYDTEGTGLTRKQVYMALKSIGITPDDDGETTAESESDLGGQTTDDDSDGKAEDKPQAREARGLSLEDFLEKALALRTEERAFFRSNVGFSPEEVENLRARFVQFDADGSGAIENTELKALLEDCFPFLATSFKFRPYLLKILQEADENSAGELDFPDFLRVMRQMHDLQERDIIKKEQEAVKSTGFKFEEVEGFREIFHGAAVVPEGCDKVAAEIHLPDLARMFSAVCPLGDRNLLHLVSVYEDVVGSRTTGADFPEFLRLMRRVLDENFANLEEYTRGADPEDPGGVQRPKLFRRMTSRRLNATLAGLLDS